MQLREASDVLGVHYQTAYGWVRQGLLPARKTARGYEVSDDDVSALAARRASGTAPRPQIRVRDWAAQADRLHAAIVSGDETQARHLFDRLARGVPLADLCERVVAPALARIGEDWAAGELAIATEHRASAICERLIAARTHQPHGRPRGVAVTATPPGERHGLPSLMATACLREDRWLVHHLAYDLPVAEVTRVALDTGASLVVLSATTGESVRLAGTAAAAIMRAAPGRYVLAGRPGDTLSRLRQLAREAAAGQHGGSQEHEVSPEHDGGPEHGISSEHEVRPEHGGSPEHDGSPEQGVSPEHDGSPEQRVSLELAAVRTPRSGRAARTDQPARPG